MNLLQRHRAIMGDMLEDTDKYAEEVRFDLSSSALSWLGAPGVVVTPVFSLCGLVTITTHQDEELGGVGITTLMGSVNIKMSSIIDKVSGVPSDGMKITCCVDGADMNFLVEKGQTLVDYRLDEVTYLLTGLGV